MIAILLRLVITMISGVVTDDKSIETYLYSDGGEEAVKIPATHTRIIRQSSLIPAKTGCLYTQTVTDCDCTSQLKYLNPANMAVNIPSSP